MSVNESEMYPFRAPNRCQTLEATRTAGRRERNRARAGTRITNTARDPLPAGNKVG
jgi:hypothetical protein